MASLPKTPRLLGVVAALAVAAACIAPPGITTTTPPPRAAAPATVRVRLEGRIVSVPIEEYVLGSILSEVSPVGDAPVAVDRIFEVQAIIARSYAAAEIGRHRAEGYDLCDGTHCQLYEPSRLRTSRFAAAAAAAVQRTRGQILVFANQPAETLFHADCGGYTTNPRTAWGSEPVPYLLSEPDDVAVAHRAWRLTITPADLRLALNAAGRTQVGRRLDAVEIEDRDASGRAVEVLLKGDRSLTVRGEELRAALNQTLGDTAIQSTRFSIRRTDSAYVFDGTGFGHGVGLCQVGAAARIRRGETVESILAHYFPNTALARR